MICRHCSEYQELLNLEKVCLRKGYLTEFQETIKEFYDSVDCDDEVCENCESGLIRNEVFFQLDDNWMENFYDLLGHIISNSISSCESCSEISEVEDRTRRYFNEPGEEEILERYTRLIPVGNELNDFVQETFDGIEMDSDKVEEICKNIVCPNCGHGRGQVYEEKIDYGRFGSWDTIYTQDDKDNFEQDFFGDEIALALSKIEESISVEDLEKLEFEKITNSIVQSNRTFKELNKIISKSFKENLNAKNSNYHFPKRNVLRKYTMPKRYQTYRVAKNSKMSPIYKTDRMFPLPFEYSPNHGRYNEIGYSVLYLSNDINNLENEVKVTLNDCLDCGVFRFKKNKVLFPVDLLFEQVEYQKMINKSVPNDSNEKNKRVYFREYILTNIIAQICKNCGYDGIVYGSVHSGNALNYAFFEPKSESECIRVFRIE